MAPYGSLAMQSLIASARKELLPRHFFFFEPKRILHFLPMHIQSGPVIA